TGSGASGLGLRRGRVMNGPDPAGGTNPDGSPKEPGQQFEEIEKTQREARRKRRKKLIENIEKSRQRDREELERDAERGIDDVRRRRAERKPPPPQGNGE